MAEKNTKPTKVTGVNIRNAGEITSTEIVERVTTWIEQVSPQDLAVNAAKANLKYTSKMRFYDPLKFRYTGGLGAAIKYGRSAVRDAEDALAGAADHTAEIREHRERHLDQAKKALRGVRKSIRIPVDVLEKVQYAARILDTTPSDIIRIAVDELFLDSGKGLLELSDDDYVRALSIMG